MSELIAAVRVTPVAFRDLPLLNSVGVHEPFALRTIVEVPGGRFPAGRHRGRRARHRRHDHHVSGARR